jgi:hypothetical protein
MRLRSLRACSAYAKDIKSMLSSSEVAYSDRCWWCNKPEAENLMLGPLRTTRYTLDIYVAKPCLIHSGISLFSITKGLWLKCRRHFSLGAEGRGCMGLFYCFNTLWWGVSINWCLLRMSRGDMSHRGELASILKQKMFNILGCQYSLLKTFYEFQMNM